MDLFSPEGRAKVRVREKAYVAYYKINYKTHYR